MKQKIKEKEKEFRVKFNSAEIEFLLLDDKLAYEEEKIFRHKIRNIARRVKFYWLVDNSIIYQSGKDWDGITDEMRAKRWYELKDEKWIYYAGRDWDGITDKMRIKKWNELKEEEWICYIGVYWNGITDKMRMKKWHEMKGNRNIYLTGRDWHGVTDKMRIEKWYKLKDEEWIYYAGKDWRGITNEMRNEQFKELKDLKYVLKALNDWEGIDTKSVFMKILTSEIKYNYYDISYNVRDYIGDSFQKTKEQVFKNLLNGEINHELFVKNYPVIREKILLESGLKEKDLSNFDYFYQNLSMSYGLLK